MLKEDYSDRMKRSDVSDLKQLSRLRQDGILTAKEFTAEKQRILKAGNEPVAVLRPTWRLFWVGFITLGGYWYRLFYEMRRLTNEAIGRKRHPMLHAVLFVVPLVNLFPLWRLSQDLRAAHSSVKLPWPIDSRVEPLLLITFGVSQVAGTVVGWVDDPAALPVALWIVAGVSVVVSFGYFIRLLWSFNDYWRKKLGTAAGHAKLGADIGWSYLWILAIFLISMLIGIIIFSADAFTDPALLDCYDRQYQKDEQADSLEQTVARAMQTGDTATVNSLRPVVDKTAAEIGQLDIECRNLENRIFGY